MIFKLTVNTQRQGLHEISDEVNSYVAKANIDTGLCILFLQHTSASLLIQENADPTAKKDLEKWLNALVPFSRDFTHTLEGKDDMPSHIKAALTQTSLTIPIIEKKIALGTWQGIYLWEHREHPQIRNIIIQIIESN